MMNGRGERGEGEDGEGGEVERERGGRKPGQHLSLNINLILWRLARCYATLRSILLYR